MRTYLETEQQLRQTPSIPIGIEGVFTMFLCITMLADLAHGAHLLNSLNPTKLSSISLVFIGVVVVLINSRLYVQKAYVPLILLCLIPPLAHGYVNQGLILFGLLVLSLNNVEFNLKHVAISGAVFQACLITLAVIGVVLTGDINYLRDEVVPLGFYQNTPLSNPNVFSRTIVIILPLVYLAYKRRYISRYVWNILVIGSVFSVSIVAMSRTNTLALIVMYVFLMVYSKKRIKTLIHSFLLILLLVGAYTTSDIVEEKIDRVGEIFTATSELVDEADSYPEVFDEAPARSKTWAASVVMLKDKPWFGAGKFSEEIVGNIGATKKEHEGDGVRNIAVHGGFLNIATTTGIIGASLFLLTLIAFYMKAGYVGKMFIIGTLVSQMGADVYAHTLFWLILGILLHVDRKIDTRKTSMGRESYI